jgi:hypothetical protein
MQASSRTSRNKRWRVLRRRQPGQRRSGYHLGRLRDALSPTSLPNEKISTSESPSFVTVHDKQNFERSVADQGQGLIFLETATVADCEHSGGDKWFEQSRSGSVVLDVLDRGHQDSELGNVLGMTRFTTLIARTWASGEMG